MSDLRLRTERLELIAADEAMLVAAMRDRDELARLLDAAIPTSWPPELLDAAALQYTLDKVRQGPGHGGWWMWFVLLVDGVERTLIGSGGYKGPPVSFRGQDGVVEVGYGILPDFRGRGYATELTKALIERAFAHPAVTGVAAETLPEFAASIRVMSKCGMAFIGDGSEPGTIRYEVMREKREGQ